MYRLIALLLLAGCAVTSPPPTTTFRNPAAPIYSSAVLQPDRLAGRWQQVASFGPQGCTPGGAEIAQAGQGLTITYRLCGASEARGAGAMTVAGPGRFEVPGQPDPWWILWADGDYRTLVIGTPGGGFGYVLNRGKIAPDRMVAARDILEWNGYQLSRMQVY